MKNIFKHFLTVAAVALVLVFCAPFLPGHFTAVNAQAQTGYVYSVRVDSGYLALRSAKAFDNRNEIGKLYTGDTVQVEDTGDPQYWFVYAPTLGRAGYVNKDYLVQVASNYVFYDTMTVRVDSGYLALRTAKAYDYSNEIGKLYTGDAVEVISVDDSQYWYVYAPKLGKNGYVNKDYLTGNAPVYADYYTAMSVRVDTGYLALRNAKAYDTRNEIGKLYTGDVVSVIDTSDSQYWYVYAPSLQNYGYVNKDYLAGTVSRYFDSTYTYTVRVESGYLALRNEMAYDAENEIGKLYTGQTVQMIDTGDGTYWYVYAPTLGLYGYVNAKYLY